MSHRFHAADGLIVVRAEVWGPEKTKVVRLALDTGCETTTIHSDHLTDVGYDLVNSRDIISTVTTSRHDSAIRVSLEYYFALGIVLDDYPVLAAKLPAGIEIDGLLGVDFMRGRHLDIDFRNGVFSLT